MILHLLLLPLLITCTPQKVREMITAESILHRIWEKVPTLAENKLDDYIYSGFEFTDCNGTKYYRSEFIKRFLGNENGTNEFPSVKYTELVKSPMKKWRHPKGDSYPEYLIQSYFLFDTEISGVPGRVGFAARIKDGVPMPWVLDKVIQYNCPSSSNGILFKNYAQHIKAQRFFDNMQKSSSPSNFLVPSFTLYYCANRLVKNPVETFLEGLQNGVKVAEVQAMTANSWTVQIEWAGRILDAQMEYTTELSLLGAREHNC